MLERVIAPPHRGLDNAAQKEVTWRHGSTGDDRMATQLKAIDESWDEGERATVADTPYTRRARYFDSGNAFALKYPPVPCHQFLAERSAGARSGDRDRGHPARPERPPGH